MITQESAEKAVDWLRDNARRLAAAEANLAAVEEYRKVIKSEIMQEHAHLPVAAQEREAYADPRYKQHLEAMQEAHLLAAELRFLARAAETRVSVWQTQSRNERVGP